MNDAARTDSVPRTLDELQDQRRLARETWMQHGDQRWEEVREALDAWRSKSPWAC